MEDKEEEEQEDKYMLDTNTDDCVPRISAATWVMITWIAIFFLISATIILCWVSNWMAQ